MKTYSLDFLEDAKAEWHKLNQVVKDPFKKKLKKVLVNPQIQKNKMAGSVNRYKIKLRSAGYRLVYEVDEKQSVVLVIAVGRRDNEAVYRIAETRRQ